MSEGFDKLKSIGAQKIHENTHISKLHAQAILHESFDNMTKIQFCGFISILEREYGVKLDALKEKALEYFNENCSNSIVAEQETSVFVEPTSKRNLTKIYIAIGIVVFLIALVITTISSSSDSSKMPSKLDNSAIESAKSVTVNQNMADPEPVEIEPVVEPVVIKSFTIKPKSKLWIGYIELGVHKKNQKTITEELVLDPNKDWLLSLGHGYVDFDINGEVTEYKKGKNLRFVYRDGELTKIGFEEFKRINKGDEW